VRAGGAARDDAAAVGRLVAQFAAALS
jgi:hypothetical protein